MLKSIQAEQMCWAVGAGLTVLVVAWGLEAVRFGEYGVFVLSMVVLGGALFGGFLAGITATIASILTASYLFIAPIHSFRVASASDLASLSLVCLEGILLSLFSERNRRLRNAHRMLAADLALEIREHSRVRNFLRDVETDFAGIRDTISRVIDPALRSIDEARGRLEEECRGKVTAERLLSDISEAANLIAAFSKPLNAYARGTSSSGINVVSSRQVLSQALDLLEPVINDTCAAITIPQDDLPLLHLQHSDLLKVFQGLLLNAIFPQRSPCRVDVRWQNEGSRLVVSFSDNGPGLIPLHRAEAFTLFRQRDFVRPGHEDTSLALCRRIVRAYGGEMWLKSSPGMGSTVSFSIPL